MYSDIWLLSLNIVSMKFTYVILYNESGFFFIELPS